MRIISLRSNRLEFKIRPYFVDQININVPFIFLQSSHTFLSYALHVKVTINTETTFIVELWTLKQVLFSSELFDT